MALCQAEEAIEAVKEMIVAALSGSRHEGAHGEGVNKLVIEMLILRQRCCRNRAGGAGLNRKRRPMMSEGQLLRIDTDMVSGSIAQPALGVYRAGKVIVQIAALGHGRKESLQRKRTRSARLFHTRLSLLLRRLRWGRSFARRLRLRGKNLQQNGEHQSKLREAGATA